MEKEVIDFLRKGGFVNERFCFFVLKVLGHGLREMKERFRIV